MIALTLDEVASATAGRVVGGAVTITSVSCDSRSAGPGDLFVALRGLVHDGHDHLPDALAAGAAAYLAEREVAGGHPGVLVDDTAVALAAIARAVRDRVDPTVVAVTGSVGKTTTKDLTAAAVGGCRRTAVAPASYNNEVGVPLTCLAVEGDTEVLVAEVGARGLGQIARLIPLLRPDVAVVTSVGAAHLELFGDLETVARAKAELIEGLGPRGTAVLNADDARVAAMAGRAAGTVLTYGSSARAHLRAAAVELDRLARPRFVARTPWGEVAVEVPLAGAHQVGNALAALAVAGVLGVGMEAAAEAIGRARVAAWRSEVVEAAGVVVVNDAYNANPASTEAALKTLVRIARSGRTWAVLGPMAELGHASREEHDRVGRLCVRLGVDLLVVVGDEAWPIREGADLEGFFGVDRWHVADPAAALELLRELVQPGDVVLVKASRVAGLERVAGGLLEHLAQRGPVTGPVPLRAEGAP